MIPTPLLCPPCSSINVTLGAHSFKQQERTQQVIQVRRAIRHPDYNPKTFSNDIMLLQTRKTPTGPALLRSDHCPPRSSCPVFPSHPGCLTSLRGRGERWGPCSLIMASRPEDHRLSQTLVSSHQLERKAKQTSAVKPLSLPRAKARLRPGQVCSLAGWGQVALGAPAATLQEAELTVQEDWVCETLFPRHCSRASQICVRDPRKAKIGFISFPTSKHRDLGGMSRPEAVSSSSAETFGSLVLESNVFLFFP